MRQKLFSLLAIALLFFYISGCEESTGEAKGTILLSGQSSILLPPGYSGYLAGSTLVVVTLATPPPVRDANCFSGVPNPGDMGIGSAGGYTKDYLGTVMLPVNVNLGATVLGSYTIRVEVSHPSLQIDTTGVGGSYPWLATDNCLDRGCAPVCVEHPESFPRQFNPAPGFEPAPLVTGTATGITIEAVDGTTASPATQTINLCNVRINIVDNLPFAGAVISFSVRSLKHPSGSDIRVLPTPDGIIIERFAFQ